METINIRPLQIADYQIITILTNQLASETNDLLTQNQIKSIKESANDFVFVAIVNDIIVAYIHIVKTIRLTQATFLEICALVVDKNNRRKGIGKMLIEKSIKSMQSYHKKEKPKFYLNKVRVRCNLKRKEAHLFYKELGFTISKQQLVFEKKHSLKLYS